MEWQVTEIGLSPRGYWTHADEDLVGTVVGVSRSLPSFDSCARVKDTVAALGTARRLSGDAASRTTHTHGSRPILHRIALRSVITTSKQI